MSLRGYWRTLSERTAVSPAIRITRLTTMARTGRLTKMSVNLTVVSRSSVVFRLRRGVVRMLDLVVHLDRRTAPQLERARGHDLLPRRDAGKDRDLVAPAPPELHELLAHPAVALALRTFQVRDHVDGVAVGRVADRGGGQGSHPGPAAQHDLRLHEHSGPQASLGIREGGLHLDVAGRG